MDSLTRHPTASVYQKPVQRTFRQRVLACFMFAFHSNLFVLAGQWHLKSSNESSSDLNFSTLRVLRHNFEGLKQLDVSTVHPPAGSTGKYWS